MKLKITFGVLIYLHLTSAYAVGCGQSLTNSQTRVHKTGIASISLVLGAALAVQPLSASAAVDATTNLDTVIRAADQSLADLKLQLASPGEPGRALKAGEANKLTAQIGSLTKQVVESALNHEKKFEDASGGFPNNGCTTPLFQMGQALRRVGTSLTTGSNAAKVKEADVTLPVSSTTLADLELAQGRLNEAKASCHTPNELSPPAIVDNILVGYLSNFNPPLKLIEENTDANLNSQGVDVRALRCYRLGQALPEFLKYYVKRLDGLDREVSARLQHALDDYVELNGAIRPFCGYTTQNGGSDAFGKLTSTLINSSLKAKRSLEGATAELRSLKLNVSVRPLAKLSVSTGLDALAGRLAAVESYFQAFGDTKVTEQKRAMLSYAFGYNSSAIALLVMNGQPKAACSVALNGAASALNSVPIYLGNVTEGSSVIASVRGVLEAVGRAQNACKD